MKPICPTILATRIQAASTGEGESWLANQSNREMLWFLQWQSMQPGGLSALVRLLVEKFPEQFQTKLMASIQPQRGGLYSIEQCLQVWRDRELRRCFLDANSASGFVGSGSNAAVCERVLSKPEEIRFSDLPQFLSCDIDARDAGGHDATGAALRAAAQKFNRPWLLRSIAARAVEELPAWLAKICLSNGESFHSRYCLNLERLIRDYMELHASETAAQIAETTITKAVRRELDFAVEECAAVPIVGESRYGKTRSVENWCRMHPGRARLVTVPESNNELEFVRAHADALGIAYSSNTVCSQLKDKVEFVIRHAGLAFIYDEAHYLVPTNYRAQTPPRRLNWIRAKLIDRNVPTAFFATPQSYKQTLSKYAQETGYRIEQWLGRVAPAVVLSDSIPFQEIVAVARTQFPEFSQAQLEEMADRAILSDGYLKSLEMAGKRARFLARERGHEKPTAKDLTDACDEMMPGEPRVVTEPLERAHRASGTSIAKPVQPRGSRIAEALPHTLEHDFPRRSGTPAMLVQEPATAA